jgi:hypothetical protein
LRDANVMTLIRSWAICSAGSAANSVIQVFGHAEQRSWPKPSDSAGSPQDGQLRSTPAILISSSRMPSATSTGIVRSSRSAIASMQRAATLWKTRPRIWSWLDHPRWYSFSNFADRPQRSKVASVDCRRRGNSSRGSDRDMDGDGR